MKKRGFTLIELLAVIVVLAIIALIATPIVMNVIKNAQKGAVERSAERYVGAVELAIATNNLENGLVADGIYTVDADGNLVLGDKTLTVEVNGDKPAAGSTVAIENGQVVATGVSLTIGDYIVGIDDRGKGRLSLLCVAKGSAHSYEVGTEYSCDLGDGERTFYVLGTEGDNVKLIMNENIGETVTWCVSGNNNACAADGAKAYLASQTSGWTKVLKSQIALPEGQDIADAMGDTEWTDDIAYIGTIGPDWMITNLDENNGPKGYWTSTSYPGDFRRAWRILSDGRLGNYGYVDNGSDIGIRPVITISKTNMSL